MTGTGHIKSQAYKKIILVLYVLAVAFLCFANFNNIHDVPLVFLGIRMDKIVHFCMFFPFPIICNIVFGKETGTPLQALATISVIFSIGCIFAGLTEIIQGMLPHRTEDIKDFGADMLAIGISSILTYINAIIKIRKRI